MLLVLYYLYWVFLRLCLLSPEPLPFGLRKWIAAEIRELAYLNYLALPLFSWLNWLQSLSSLFPCCSDSPPKLPPLLNHSQFSWSEFQPFILSAIERRKQVTRSRRRFSSTDLYYFKICTCDRGFFLLLFISLPQKLIDIVFFFTEPSPQFFEIYLLILAFSLKTLNSLLQSRPLNFHKLFDLLYDGVVTRDPWGKNN